MPQPGTATEEPALSRGFSLVSLSQTCCGAGLAQASFTFSVLPDAPIAALARAAPQTFAAQATSPIRASTPSP